MIFSFQYVMPIIIRYPFVNTSVRMSDGRLVIISRCSGMWNSCVWLLPSLLARRTSSSRAQISWVWSIPATFRTLRKASRYTLGRSISQSVNRTFHLMETDAFKICVPPTSRVLCDAPFTIRSWCAPKFILSRIECFEKGRTKMLHSLRCNCPVQQDDVGKFTARPERA